MLPARRRNRPRSAGALVTIVLLSIGAIIGLSQCKMVNDTVTGPLHGRKHNKPAQSCVRECVSAYEDAKDAEDDLHDENIDDCDRDRDCKEAEEARHKAVLRQLKDERDLCIRNCHHQGGGSGGRR